MTEKEFCIARTFIGHKGGGKGLVEGGRPNPSDLVTRGKDVGFDDISLNRGS